MSENCSFCGSDAVRFEYAAEFVYPVCEDYCATGPSALSESDALEKWNNPIILDPLRQWAEKAEAALQTFVNIIEVFNEISLNSNSLRKIISEAKEALDG